MEFEDTPNASFSITEEEKDLIIKKRNKDSIEAKKKALRAQLKLIQKELNELDPKPEPTYDLPYSFTNPRTGPSADDV